MVFNETVFRWYIKETMYTAIEDRLSYVEYRIVFNVEKSVVDLIPFGELY